jgi:PAS domain-containing protein
MKIAHDGAWTGRSMPRFYLDVLHGREVHKDPEGEEFANLDVARAEAVASARYLIAHGILSNEDLSDRCFLIRDENEDVLATVPFRGTLPGTLKGETLPRSQHPAYSRAATTCLTEQGAEQDFEWLVEEHGRALGHSGEQFRILVEALPAAIYMTDAAGRITFYNEAAVALAGRRPVVGQDRWCVTWRLYQPDGTPLPHDQCPMAIALKENRPVRGVGAVAERPDGTRFSFLPFPTPLHDASGALVGGVNLLLETPHHSRAENGVGPH